MNKIELLFKDKAIKRYGLDLYSKENALYFIELCRKEKIRILGIDGFFITENSIQPSLANSVDFTMKPFEGDVYTASSTFLETINEKMVFEIVCGD